MNAAFDSLLSALLLVAAIAAYPGIGVAANLCNGNEKTVFSFDTKTGKIMSICKNETNEYLVYRYGVIGKIEMQHPKILNNASWKAFSFSGIRRPGGQVNAGFGDYDLSFSVSQFNYIIFQSWDDTESTYSIGLTVHNGKSGRDVRIDGIRETQKGSLVLLENESERIKNSAQ